MNYVPIVLASAAIFSATPASQATPILEIGEHRHHQRERAIPSIIIETGVTLALEALFAANGFPTPTIRFEETETKFQLTVLSGGAVTSDSNFSTNFRSDFWRGSLSYEQENNLGPDTMSVSGSLTHFWKPHSTDHIFGDVMPFSLFSKEGSRFRSNYGVTHDVDHLDTINTTLSSVDSSGNMTSWKHITIAKHLAPEGLVAGVINRKLGDPRDLQSSRAIQIPSPTSGVLVCTFCAIACFRNRRK